MSKKLIKETSHTVDGKEVKVKVFKLALANVTREICENLYNEGIHKVYDYANKTGMLYNNCKPCDADTPTISDQHKNTCALCGSHKYL